MNKEHILLVEDDEVFSRVMTRALSHRDYQVSHAANEVDAAALIEQAIEGTGRLGPHVANQGIGAVNGFQFDHEKLDEALAAALATH